MSRPPVYVVRLRAQLYGRSVVVAVAIGPEIEEAKARAYETGRGWLVAHDHLAAAARTQYEIRLARPGRGEGPA